jgi:2-dehydropantoate 2-reductase
MKIIVLGGGALGSIIAGHLIRAGEEVVLIARGARAAHLREHGIRVRGAADFHVPCAVITDTHSVQAADALIVTVKTYDTIAALQGVRHVRVGQVCSVQNGVRKNEQLAEAFGSHKVLGATCMLGGAVQADGDVHYTLEAAIYLGELPGGKAAAAQQLVGALQRAGLSADYTARIQNVEWSKFVGWSGFTALGALTRLETYKFLSDPDTARIGARLMRETGQLATHLGMRLEDRPPLPSATIMEGTEEQAVHVLQSIGATLRERAPHMRQSALQDVQRGRRLEIEETLGYTLARAAALGIAVPTVETCYRLLAGLSRFLR